MSRVEEHAVGYVHNERSIGMGHKGALVGFLDVLLLHAFSKPTASQLFRKLQRPGYNYPQTLRCFSTFNFQVPTPAAMLCSPYSFFLRATLCLALPWFYHVDRMVTTNIALA